MAIDKRIKEWRITDLKMDKTITIRNLSAFCRTNRISLRKMYYLAKRFYKNNQLLDGRWGCVKTERVLTKTLGKQTRLFWEQS